MLQGLNAKGNDSKEIVKRLNAQKGFKGKDSMIQREGFNDSKQIIQ
jgi:hypothetical protein